jgi:predicted DNA-binding antitoxin AbrB/MazE fold protein
MGIKARYANGVFQPLEKVIDATPGKIYRIFSEEELHLLAKDQSWLKASEKSFDFWDNEEDAVYDKL